MTPLAGPIAVDAMGGDHAPGRIVDGALAAARQGVAVTLVGPHDVIRRAIDAHVDAAVLPISVVDAPDVVGMDESPTAALRRKPRSSIRVAADLVGSGMAVALVSAGHTGATVVASHAVFGMLPGVDRPALAPVLPTRTGVAVLLDAGATVECRPQHLLQFGVMGAVYAETLLGVPRPRVGLLSIGEEEGKGNELTRDAYRLLKSAPVQFAGNVEARDVFSGNADVIVCDGFTGNVALKLSEGLVETVEELLSAELASTFTSQVGSLLSRRAFRRFRKRLDYSEYGGAPLLGVAKLAFVCHGRSSAKAIRNAIVAASRFAADGILDRVEQRVAEVLVR